MKIVLTGVETNNKGAELMLYAILQEIEREHPEAKVYISRYQVKQGLQYVKTSLRLHFFPYEYMLDKLRINKVLNKLGVPKVKGINFVKGDYYFDGSGFLFSDQCNLWGTTPEWWEDILKYQYNNGTRIVFLPQAFGPIEEEKTKKAIAVLGRYSTILMPRDQVSYNYLKKSGLVDMKKVKKYTDFTSLVEGVFPVGYEHLKGGVCIIPNMKMMTKGGMNYEDYIHLLSAIAKLSKKSGRNIYLLNHEGPKDAELCLRCKESIGEGIEAVTNLNALEVKGLIASAYIVITSRFHGLASSLNCAVPSLATSWSHKYEELFKDYGLDNSCILPLNDIDSAIKRINELLDGDKNKMIRTILENKLPYVKAQTQQMWEMIWRL